MQIVFAIISVILLAVIIYFVVSPKSSKLLRLVAIIALALIGLSLAICGIILIKGPGEDTEPIALPFVLESDPQPAKKSDIPMVIAFLLVFLLIVVLIVRTSMHEKKKLAEKMKKADKPKPVQSPEETDDEKKEPDPGSLDEDNFDLGI